MTAMQRTPLSKILAGGKSLRSLPLVVLILVAMIWSQNSLAQNEVTATQGSLDSKNFFVTGFVAASNAQSKDSTQAGWMATGGAKGTYLLNPAFGVFLGADYVNRNATIRSTSFSNHWVDLPLGFVFQFLNTPERKVLLNAGAYYSFHLAGSREAAGVEADNSEDSTFGFLIQLETYFETSSLVDLGLSFGFKAGAQGAYGRDVFDPNNSTEFNQYPYEVFVGLSALF